MINSFGNTEQILRVFVGTQLFFAGISSIFIEFEKAILCISLINLFLVLWFYSHNTEKKYLFENNVSDQNNRLTNYFTTIFFRFIKKSNLSIIIGSVFMSNLFLIIEKQYSIFLVVGLQLLNAATNFYHLFKRNHFFERNILHYLEKIKYRLIYSILVICSFVLINLTGKFNLNFHIIGIVIFGEIGLIHISNKRILKSDFKFVYRLAAVVLIEYLYLYEFLSIEYLLLSCAFIYYYLSFKYGEIYILDSRPIQL
jgi:hypothetical protein